MTGLLLALTACGSTDPNYVVPDELTAPSCQPPAGLADRFNPAPPIRAGDNMTQTVATDRSRERSKDRIHNALIDFLERFCFPQPEPQPDEKMKGEKNGN